MSQFGISAPLTDDAMLHGFRRHATKFHNHNNKLLVLQKYSKHANDPLHGGLRRCTTHVAAWLAFAPPGPCAVITSNSDLEPAALLARLLTGLRVPGPRLQKALSLVKGRNGECNCAGHQALEPRLHRLTKEQIEKPNTAVVSLDEEKEDDLVAARDALVSAAKSSKLSQRLAKRFYHDALTFKAKADDEQTAEVI